MRTFTDNNGRIWTVVVNVAAIKRVRAICGIDINSIVEIGEDGKPKRCSSMATGCRRR